MVFDFGAELYEKSLKFSLKSVKSVKALLYLRFHGLDTLCESVLFFKLH